MDSKPFNQGLWTGKYSIVEKSGLVLTDLLHNNYNLARDVRVFRIWLNPEEKKWPPIYLGTRDFEFDGKVIPLGAEQPPFPFENYKTLFGYECNYVSRVVPNDPLRNDPKNRLRITQRYLFTNYAANPPHEAGGWLEATRLFPLLTFSTTNRLIKSIRIDYCFHLILDNLFRFDEFKRGPGKIPAAENQAGVFRDVEHFYFLKSIGKALAAKLPEIKDFFIAAEKPLQFEIVGKGLLNGRPTLASGGGEKLVTWDSIHWWGLGLGMLPSTPGAFHTAHLHWRWGEVFGNPTRFDKKFVENAPGPKATGFGRQEFKGVNGGALVDPKSPNQTIRFAVTKSERFNAILSGTSEWDFENEFTSLGRPQELSRGANKGADMLLWMSFQVDDKRSSSAVEPFTSTVFPHGLFFAHNPERFPRQSEIASSFTLGKSSPERSVPPIWTRDPDSGYY